MEPIPRRQGEEENTWIPFPGEALGAGDAEDGAEGNAEVWALCTAVQRPVTTAEGRRTALMPWKEHATGPVSGHVTH